MKILLTSAMALGVIVTLGTIQPASATPSSQQASTVLVGGGHHHGGHHRGDWGRGGGWGGYYGGPGYYYGPGYAPAPYFYDDGPDVCFGPLCLF